MASGRDTVQLGTRLCPSRALELAGPGGPCHVPGVPQSSLLCFDTELVSQRKRKNWNLVQGIRPTSRPCMCRQSGPRGQACDRVVTGKWRCCPLLIPGRRPRPSSQGTSGGVCSVVPSVLGCFISVMLWLLSDYSVTVFQNT